METEEDRQKIELRNIFKREFFGFDEINRDILDNIIFGIDTPENVKDIYSIIIKLIPLIQDLGFNVDIVPLIKSDDGVYWSDYATSYLEDNFFDKDFMYFTIYLESGGNKINIKKDISVDFSFLTKDMKCNILQLFYESLPNNFDWNGDNNKVMIIKYSSIENPVKLDFDQLNDDDTFPLLRVYIDFETTKDYGLFDYMENVNIVNEIENMFPNKISCSYGDFDIDVDARRVNFTEVNQIYKSLQTILRKVKRKSKNDFGVKKCKFYYYESKSTNEPKKYVINCDPEIKDKFFGLDKYL